MSRTSKPKTPGDVATDETDGDAATAGAADLEGAGEGAAASGDGEAATKTVTISEKKLEQMLMRAAAQGAASVQRAAAPAGRTAEADLPDQSEIDPRKITRPTLSKQGYVVPIKYGEPADPSIKR